MRNLKLGLFTILCLLTAGIEITTAFDIQIGPQGYYGTLTLNRINIMKNNSITGIVLDGSGYSIKIGQGAGTDTGSIRVREICDRNGNNCKIVSEISTGSVNVENTNNVLSWNNSTTIAKIAEQNVDVRLPSNPAILTNTNNALSWNTSVKVASIGSQDLNVKLPANPATVTNTNNALSWNTSVKVASIGSQDLNVKLPANPATVTNTNNTLSWNSSVNVASVGGQYISVKLPANPARSNTSGQAGIVANPNGTSSPNKVRKTDDNGNPARRDDAGGTLRETTSDGGIKPINHNLTIKSTSSTTTLLSDSTNFKIGGESGYIYTKPNGSNYSEYRMGINTSSPKATLEIAGSLRINTTSSYCGLSTTCDDNTLGTIIYRGGSFWGCTPEGRQKFDMQPHVENPSSRVNNSCVVYSR